MPNPPSDEPRPARSQRPSRPPRPAAYHADVRRAHAEETAEDYVEAIALLIDTKGVARVKDLAAQFGVSHVTVSRTIARLVRDGLAETEPYKPITLTPQGRQLAEQSRERHELVVRFLIALGVDEDTARTDAEGIEHHVSRATLDAMRRLAERSGVIES